LSYRGIQFSLTDNDRFPGRRLLSLRLRSGFLSVSVPGETRDADVV